MSWHYLPTLAFENLPSFPAVAAEFSAGNCSAGEPCAPLKSTPSVGKCSCAANWMDAYRASLSGMMSAPLTAGPGVDAWTLSRAGFPVRTSRALANVRDLKASAAACGASLPESSARYDPATHSWKTAQCSLLAGLESSWVTWPRWGTMRAGALYPQPTPSGLTAHRALITSESGCLSLPTPCEMDAATSMPHRAILKDNGRVLTVSSRGRTGGSPLRAYVALRFPTPKSEDAQCAGGHRGTDDTLYGLVCRPKRLATATGRDWRTGKAGPKTLAKQNMNERPLNEQVGGALNPPWVDFLMGWPIGWTDLQPLGTGNAHKQQRSHGRC